MDPSTRALKVLVEGGISDALLAKYVRSLLGPEERPSPRRPHPSDTPALPVPMAPAVTESAPAEGAKLGLVGLHDDLVRVNVRVEGRRTSVSFPKSLWNVLERRFNGRDRLKDAVQTHAVRFKGRGNRSAFVLDQLEADLARMAAAANALPMPVETAPSLPPIRLANLPPLTSPTPDLFSSQEHLR